MARTAIDEFVVTFKVQREWRWLILTAFFLGGVGGGLFLVSLFGGFAAGMVAGLLVVILGKSTAHILFLGRPERFWRIFAAPQSSWISRGIYIVTAFSLFGILHTLPYFEPFRGLPWSPELALGRVIQALAILSALLLVTYTGFVMAYSPAIQFWGTPLLPALFGLYSLSAGTAGLFVMVPWVGQGSLDVKALEVLEMAFLVGAITLLGMYLSTMLYSTLGAKEAVRILAAGELSLVFWGGVITVGLLLPLAVGASIYGGLVAAPQAPGLMAAAGVLELLGGFLLRYSLLRAGVFAPVI